MSAQRDLISSLPDEILGKILSLLRTNRAASTSVLSKRWRNLLAFVDNLELNDASGNHRYFCDFVDNTLALLSNSSTVKRFSLDCRFAHDSYRVDSWIRTVLDRGFLELHLRTADMHCIDTEFFTSNKLVKLTICNGFYPEGRLPPGGVFFPALKSLTLDQVAFANAKMYENFISGCPVLEELFLHYDDDDDNNHPSWNGVVSSPSVKRLTIHHDWPNHREEAHDGCWFMTPSLEYLEYSSYVAEQYEVDLGSLVEARLDLQPWERPIYEDESEDEDESDVEVIFGDVTNLVAGISNVKTLHLSSDSLEVFHLCCDTMPVFRKLLTLSFESDKESGWQVVPLLLNNSPNLETLIIKGLVHQVTNRCGDACACIPKTETKTKKKKMECCLLTCRVKVLNVSRFQGTSREMKQMEHFLANLKCLETVKVGVKVNPQKYLSITNALMELPRVSTNSRIHFF